MPSDEQARTVAGAWLGMGAGDLEAARACLASESVPGWVAGFHLQQAVEKVLKGLLVLVAVEPPRIHDLIRLDGLLRTAGGTAPLPLAELELLQPFAVEDRYPALFAPPTDRDELRRLLPVAERAVAALRAGIG